MVHDLLVVGQPGEPGRGQAVGGPDPSDLLGIGLVVRRHPRLEGLEGPGEDLTGAREQAGDFVGQRPGCLEHGRVAGVGRLGWVVDEQGHPHVGVLLEGGRQQGGADHPDVLPV